MCVGGAMGHSNRDTGLENSSGKSLKLVQMQKKNKKKLQKGTEKDKDEGGALGKFEGVSHS